MERLSDVGTPYLPSLELHLDDRGSFLQVYNSDLPFTVKRVYVLHTTKGVIRGLHGHKKEEKAFMILDGMVKFVVLPLDTDEDPSVIDIHEFVLSDRKAEILVVPSGYYNGFVTLSSFSTLLCLSSSILLESLEDDVRVDPFKFGDFWSVKHR